VEKQSGIRRRRRSDHQPAQQPRRQHAGIVGDDEIRPALRKRGKSAMVGLFPTTPPLAMDDEAAGRSAPARLLRNLFSRVEE
jgi:hypothetical protein